MSAYGNPQPYRTPELERSAILGRLRVARGIAARATDETRRRQWAATVDELLDHLAEVEVRAATAARERPRRE